MVSYPDLVLVGIPIVFASGCLLSFLVVGSWLAGVATGGVGAAVAIIHALFISPPRSESAAEVQASDPAD